MVLARLILIALCGWVDESPDAAALVRKLASPDQAARAEAAGKLEEIGRSALPALHRAREADDVSLRLQVERLIDLIERQRLLRATRVRLDFEQVPLSAAAEALKTQTGFPMNFTIDQTLKNRPVTLHVSAPVPFWEALDRLGAACGVRYAPRFTYSPDPPEPTIMLVSSGGPPIPASDAGPFRVHLVRLSRHRELKGVRPPGQAVTRESLAAELHVFAEPGLVVNPTGSVVVEEAVDDGGRDLRLEFPFGPAPNRPRPRFEEPSATLCSLTVPLSSKTPRGKLLRRLKGRVPISVITRTGDPIVVPLAGSEGKTISRRGVTLSVSSLRRAPGNTSFRLMIDRKQGDGRSSPDPASPLDDYQPAYAIEGHLQVQDDQGRPLWWYPGQPQNAGGGRLESLITVYTVPGKTPTRILYHGVVGTTTELTFKFKDLPLP